MNTSQHKLSTVGRLTKMAHRLIVATLGLAFFNFSAVVAEAQSRYATYQPGTITITRYTGPGYTGPGGAVVIPSTINGMQVTGIGFQAFADCTNLTSANRFIRAFSFLAVSPQKDKLPPVGSQELQQRTTSWQEVLVLIMDAVN